MAAIAFDIGRRKASFTLGSPAAIGIGFNVSINADGGEPYKGEYTVKPKFDTQTLATKDKLLREDVTVEAIEVARVSNPAGGKTIFIGGITNG